MRPFVGTHYIGRYGNEDVVDEYGDVVARCSIKGGDWIRGHDELKMMTNAVFKQAGFETTVEVPNIFHEKAPSDCIDRYLNLHQKKDAIIPDILVHNYPTDNNSAGARNMEAIFDIN